LSVYWDTSVVLKLYVEEMDSERWRRKLTELNTGISESLLFSIFRITK